MAAAVVAVVAVTGCGGVARARAHAAPAADGTASTVSPGPGAVPRTPAAPAPSKRAVRPATLPPPTPRTAAGAAAFLRSYFALMNGMIQRSDVAEYRLLAPYYLRSCVLCAAYAADLRHDAQLVRSVQGVQVGGGCHVSAVRVAVLPEQPSAAYGTLQLSFAPSVIEDGSTGQSDGGARAHPSGPTTSRCCTRATTGASWTCGRRPDHEGTLGHLTRTRSAQHL